MHEDHKNSFGFEKVSPTEKVAKVFEVFKEVAPKYDMMNDLMSFGIHRIWKEKLVDLLRPRPGMSLLDVAGGTGDVGLRFLDRSKTFDPSVSVTISDQNQAMLDQGRDKAFDRGITKNLHWICADATALPFPDDSFDAVTISFGLRNVMDLAQALKEMHRVLRPGGQFFCLEFSKAKDPLLAKVYHAYSFSVIPKIGKLVTQNEEAYQYLVESIERFPSQEELATLMRYCGFNQVAYQNLTGGIVAIHSAQK